MKEKVREEERKSEKRKENQIKRGEKNGREESKGERIERKGGMEEGNVKEKKEKLKVGRKK